MLNKTKSFLGSMETAVSNAVPVVLDVVDPVLELISETMQEGASNILKTGDLLSNVDTNQIKSAVSNVNTQQIAQQTQATIITKADGYDISTGNAKIASAVDSISSALAGITIPDTISSAIIAALKPEAEAPLALPKKASGKKTSSKKAPAKKKIAKKTPAKNVLAKKSTIQVNIKRE
jgi:hypothetical protein